MSSSALTMYFGQGNTVETRLYKVNAGSYTKLGRDAAAVAAGDILTITAKSNAIALMKNGTTIIFAYDTSIASGDPGIWAIGASIPNFDAFQCGTYAALPTITASDSFNRANENPLSGGGNWSSITGVNSPLQLLNNKAQGIVVSSDNANVYTGASFADDQYAEAMYQDVADDSGPTLRAVTGSWTAYHTWSGGGTGTHRITRVNNGTATELESLTPGPRYGCWVIGDRIGFSVVGYPTATLTLWKNGVPVYALFDSNALQSGKPGLYIYNTLGGGGVTFQNWVGGSFGSGAVASAPALMMMGIGD
jgi:hypothetical protein